VPFQRGENTVQSSYLATIAEAIPAPAIQNIASQFGTSERTILDGVQASIAAVISGLSQKSGDKTFLSQVLQTAQATPETGLATALSNGALANPASSFLTGSRQFLSSIFGDKLGGLTEAIATHTGLRSAAATTLLALGGQTVLGFLGNKVRDGSVNASTLPAFLAKESSALLAMLPAGFSTVTTGHHKIEVNPVIAQAVQVEKKSSIWLWLLPLLLALLLGFWWYRSHQTPAPIATEPPPAAVSPTVTSSTGADLGALVGTKLPDGTTLQIPQRGVEGKLLAFIQDPNRAPDKTSWFDFDRLLFATNSTTLEPQSTEQLTAVAGVLKAYPAVHLTIGGYTDNTGDASYNQKLSQGRADSVVAQLESMGIASDRLVAKGYGEDHPVGDNSTPDGRALNRRISMLVTSK
jgi:outer membrane protein OmpA-like peptidoglycan-associated protein